MDNRFKVANITEALQTRRFPTVTLWNRLEARPRTEDFDRALKAEVRDPLWMLSRQWQLGEFAGDDAGSPIFAKLHLSTTALTKYRPDMHAAEAFNDTAPLEATVERRAIPFEAGTTSLALDIRLLMGRHWLKLITGIGGGYAADFVRQYPIASPDPTQASDAAICAHPAAWQAVSAVAGRRMDGAKLYAHLMSDAGNRAYDGIAAVDNGDKPALDDAAVRFIRWFDALYYQPTRPEDDAWLPDRLEYQFAVSAPVRDKELVLRADEYYHGHLDWYNLDVDSLSTGLGDVADASPDPRDSDTQTLIPTSLVFNGMPNTRWWEFEDRQTNFGDIKPDTVDIAKLLLIEFGLVYANDWFMIPIVLPAGTVANVRGMAVTNVFGERFWIEAAGSGPDDEWQRWSMFGLNTKGDHGEAADTSLVVLPSTPKIQESEPLEAVLLLRDEVANMVWGVETRVPLPSGWSAPGGEAAIETRAYHQRLLAGRLGGAPLPPPLLANDAIIRYQVMNDVPEHWIPFIPVHVPNDNREIQLQRAAMPRLLNGDPDKPQKVRPRTILLREGLDRVPATAYFIHEEEVPRAGVRVTQSFQRTRYYNGRVVTWLGVRKQTGRGEGSSGLAFDRIVEKPKAT